MQRRKVVLPEPDGPSRTTTWPVWTSRSMPLSTSVPWKDLVTLTACTSGRCRASAPVLRRYVVVSVDIRLLRSRPRRAKRRVVAGLREPKPRPKYRSR